MVNEASVSQPCRLWVAHPGCAEEVNNRHSRNFLLSSHFCLWSPALPTKTYLHSHKHPPGTHTLSQIQWHTNRNSPPTSISLRSCTITATVIHRCWILLASHKTWYAWFVQSASSVISFSFSFIFPSWATRSIFLLYESADTQRDFQDDYMPRAMGGLRSQHASLRAMTNLGENSYLNKSVNTWTARGVFHLSYTLAQVKLSGSRQAILGAFSRCIFFFNLLKNSKYRHMLQVYIFSQEQLWFKTGTYSLTNHECLAK